jgi:opacity protein-like surface antigen
LTGTGTTLLDYATKIEWFGTARVRAGYLFGDGAVLSYVTAGLAYGKVELSGTSTVSGTVDTVPFSITHAIGHSNVNTGWVVGSGTEGKVNSRLDLQNRGPLHGPRPSRRHRRRTANY